jgi:recombination protein RecT
VGRPHRRSAAENRSKIFGAAAPGVDADRFTESFMHAFGRAPKLADCTNASLIMTLTDSATLGLVISSVEGEGHAVPRRRGVKDDRAPGGWRDVWESQFQAGYLGKLKLAYESPMCAGLTVHAVREGDVYKALLGTDQTIHHEPRGESTVITHVYAVYWFASGNRRCVSWTREDVEEHAKAYVDSKSLSNKKSAWSTAWKAMAAKTVLLELLKYAPMKDAARRVLQAEEYADGGIAVERGLRSGDTIPTDDLDELSEDESKVDARGGTFFDDETAEAANTHAKANDPDQKKAQTKLEDMPLAEWPK